MGTYCYVPKTKSPISYAFNITWLNIIIIKEYLSGFRKGCNFYVGFSICIIKPVIVHSIRVFS